MDRSVAMIDVPRGPAAGVGEDGLFRWPGTQWVSPVQLSAGTVASLAGATETIDGVLDALAPLEPDDYLEFMVEYYRTGRERFGGHWDFQDLLTVLHAAATLLQPRRYLEIGVRRGRSLAVVAHAAPQCDLVGFDLWMANYAGMSNPGPDHVERELARCGHRGRLELVSGDSHVTVPAWLAKHPDAWFDLVNVDGDHSEAGARADLLTVLPRLRQGGAVVLDDLVHPQHRYLERLWDELLGENPDYSSRKYVDLGYGVAVAIRRTPPCPVAGS